MNPRFNIAETGASGAGKKMKWLHSQIILDYATNYTKANKQEIQQTIVIMSIGTNLHRIKWFRNETIRKYNCNR